MITDGFVMDHLLFCLFSTTIFISVVGHLGTKAITTGRNAVAENEKFTFVPVWTLSNISVFRAHQIVTIRKNDHKTNFQNQGEITLGQQVCTETNEFSNPDQTVTIANKPYFYQSPCLSMSPRNLSSASYNRTNTHSSTRQNLLPLRQPGLVPLKLTTLTPLASMSHSVQSPVIKQPHYPAAAATPQPSLSSLWTGQSSISSFNSTNDWIQSPAAANRTLLSSHEVKIDFFAIHERLKDVIKFNPFFLKCIDKSILYDQQGYSLEPVSSALFHIDHNQTNKNIESVKYSSHNSGITGSNTVPMNFVNKLQISTSTAPESDHPVTDKKKMLIWKYCDSRSDLHREEVRSIPVKTQHNDSLSEPLIESHEVLYSILVRISEQCD